MADRTDYEIELLGLLPPPLAAEIRTRLRPIRADRGQTIVSTGEDTADVFFLIEGEVHVLLYSADGREVQVQSVHAPELFGEYAAVDGAPRSATIIAASAVRLARLGRADFVRCLEASPAASMWLTRRLVIAMRRLTERVFELSAFSVSGRIRHELLRMAGQGAPSGRHILVQPAPTHAELATRIGTHREAVTRELNALAEANVLRHGRRSIEFVDLGRLAALAAAAAR